MKKILVTGATGFIGRYVIEDLLRKGHSVIASSAHPGKALEAPWQGQVQYIPFDLSQFDPDTDLYRYFGEPDALIHLAWEGLPNYKEPFHVEENFPRHVAFLENLLRNGLTDMTVTGTCLEYGLQEGCLAESFTPRPSVAYAIAKNELRIFFEQLCDRIPFVFRWVRLFYMYGKGQHPNSLLSQLDRALDDNEPVFNMSGGEQIRDYLSIEQVADLISRIALQQQVTGIINCCSGIPVKIKDLVMAHMSGRNKFIPLNKGYYPYADYEPMYFWGDDTKLKTIL
jgi:dTDP-6-deoxy-L-talose 4-dehydrogenase (NAD+)